MPLPGHHQPKGCRRWKGDAIAPQGFGRSVNPMPTKGGRLCPPNYSYPSEFSDFPMALHRVDDIKRLLDILWLGMMPYCRSWESMSSSSQLEILVWILALQYELDWPKIFINLTLLLTLFRECVINLDLQVQVHPGELHGSQNTGCT